VNQGGAGGQPAGGSAQGGASQGGAGGKGGAAGKGGAGGAASGKVAVADLRADNNRDGKVDLDDPSEDENEDKWTAKNGAIFLANIDDDEAACPKKTSQGKAINDVDLPGCFDAADEVINGPDDLLDLARLKVKPWAEAPDDATATLEITKAAADKVRFFKNDGQGNFTVFAPATGTLSAAELRAGVELAIEGKDIVRDSAVWDGYVDVKLVVHDSTDADGSTIKGASDQVRLRLAPVLTRHHLDPAEEIYVSKLSGQDSVAMRKDLMAAITAAKVPSGLSSLSETEIYSDQWTQDFFETAYMAMPAEGSKHIIHVNYRSANVYNNDKKNPLRDAGRVVFLRLRGKDTGGIQQYNLASDPNMDSLNSFGNTETIPPYTLGNASYPLGRLLRGSIKSFHPDASFATMLESQGVQPPVYIDTSWLLVGHVDETMSFLKASTPRGWVLVVNDAALAKQMLEEQQAKGNGGVKLFTGKQWLDNNDKPYSAEITIDGVLADTDVMAKSAEAVTEVDNQLEIIKAETGLTDDEIIRIPYLHMPTSGYSIAYQPGTVNGIYLSDTDFGAPAPHGPVIDGKDIFQAQMEDAFGKVGVTVRWIEDWDLYHRLSGEVHCGTNTRRAVPEGEKWWESGY
jgi:protein-arginine deiminase